jgi:hypothetical protein
MERRNSEHYSYLALEYGKKKGQINKILQQTVKGTCYKDFIGNIVSKHPVARPYTLLQFHHLSCNVFSKLNFIKPKFHKTLPHKTI